MHLISLCNLQSFLNAYQEHWWTEGPNSSSFLRWYFCFYSIYLSTKFPYLSCIPDWKSWQEVEIFKCTKMLRTEGSQTSSALKLISFLIIDRGLVTLETSYWWIYTEIIMDLAWLKTLMTLHAASEFLQSKIAHKIDHHDIHASWMWHCQDCHFEVPQK